MSGEYPDDEDLDRIRKWPAHDYRGLAEYVGSIWHWPDFWEIRGNRISAHTGGWSGNEEIMGVLGETAFWWMCWRMSLRGGHYKFVLPATKAGVGKGEER